MGTYWADEDGDTLPGRIWDPGTWETSGREWFCCRCRGVIPPGTIHSVERTRSGYGVISETRRHRPEECREWAEEEPLDFPAALIGTAIVMLVVGAIALWSIARW